jgi:uncharacterized membrane protein YdjX (TVP38/TMEM64 family)
MKVSAHFTMSDEPVGIPKILRSVALVGIVLLVPIIPFVAFGSWLEPAAAALLQREASSIRIAITVVALLSSDIFLPIPSSVVSTFAGQALGVLPGTVASWLGMTLGGAIGYALAARLGPPLARRFAQQEELLQMETLRGAAGTWLVVLTRALPVLAEAAVLVCGLHGIGWRRFLPALALANLGIASSYAALGNVAAAHGWFPFALGVSAALPILLTAIVRQRLAKKESRR